jgi:hypothetical protein
VGLTVLRDEFGIEELDARPGDARCENFVGGRRAPLDGARIEVVSKADRFGGCRADLDLATIEPAREPVAIGRQAQGSGLGRRFR